MKPSAAGRTPAALPSVQAHGWGPAAWLLQPSWSPPACPHTHLSVCCQHLPASVSEHTPTPTCGSLSWPIVLVQMLFPCSVELVRTLLYSALSLPLLMMLSEGGQQDRMLCWQVMRWK